MRLAGPDFRATTRAPDADILSYERGLRESARAKLLNFRRRKNGYSAGWAGPRPAMLVSGRVRSIWDLLSRARRRPPPTPVGSSW